MGAAGAREPAPPRPTVPAGPLARPRGWRMTEGQQPAVLSRGDEPELRRFVPSGQQKHKTCVFVLQGFSIWFTCRETRKVGTAFPERGNRAAAPPSRGSGRRSGAKPEGPGVRDPDSRVTRTRSLPGRPASGLRAGLAVGRPSALALGPVVPQADCRACFRPRGERRGIQQHTGQRGTRPPLGTSPLRAAVPSPRHLPAREPI